jgi:hypothetical protein
MEATALQRHALFLTAAHQQNSMKTKAPELPLHLAAARALRRAGKVARKRAQETQVPLVIWKDGKVVHVRIARSGSTKASR